ncbi:MAG: hypothetical protein AAF465_06930 [Pseudomonadota bacterium]
MSSNVDRDVSNASPSRQNNWSDESRELWVSMAVAAATASLRALPDNAAHSERTIDPDST